MVAGSAIVSGVPNFVVARYTSAGALDGTFNGGTPVTTLIGNQSSAYALVIQQGMEK